MTTHKLKAKHFHVDDDIALFDRRYNTKGVHGYPFHVFFGGSRDLVVWPYFYFLVFFDKFGLQLFIGDNERTH